MHPKNMLKNLLLLGNELGIENILHYTSGQILRRSSTNIVDDRSPKCSFAIFLLEWILQWQHLT